MSPKHSFYIDNFFPFYLLSFYFLFALFKLTELIKSNYDNNSSLRFFLKFLRNTCVVSTFFLFTSKKKLSRSAAYHNHHLVTSSKYSLYFSLLGLRNLANGNVGALYICVCARVPTKKLIKHIMSNEFLYGLVKMCNI